jgi:hypothetical protein
MEGKPITTFLVTALMLWAIYLWKHGRLGKPGLLPDPQEMTLLRVGVGKEQPASGGWKQGQPPAEGYALP